MSNEDSLWLIGYNFEPEYSTQELEILDETVVYENMQIPLEEWCDCGR